ncbi:hypothetical protein [Nitrospira sp. M1]
MPPLSLHSITQQLAEYHRQTGNAVDLIRVGGLALQAYGFSDRVTVDIDG